MAIALSDTGHGLEEAELLNVFDPFYSTKEVGKGTGLGLSMVYGFAKQSGGKVVVSSECGVGTTVTLVLPVAPAGTAKDEPRQVAIEQPSESKVVMVVEDEPRVRKLLIHMLKDLGYRTVEVANVPEAQAVALKTQTFDVLLSDMRLPGPSGTVFAQELVETRPDTKVVMMFGNPQAVDSHAMLGANAVLLTKPFTLESLGATLAHVLGPDASG